MSSKDEAKEVIIEHEEQKIKILDSAEKKEIPPIFCLPIPSDLRKILKEEIESTNENEK